MVDKEILMDLAGIVSLLGGKPELVKLIKEMENPTHDKDSIKKALSVYWMELSDSIKLRLSNSGNQKVKIANVN